MAFKLAQSGVEAQAEEINQIVQALNGSAGRGVALIVTQVNDADNYALDLRQLDATNGYILRLRDSGNNNVIVATKDAVTIAKALTLAGGLSGVIEGSDAADVMVYRTTAQTIANATNTPLEWSGAYENDYTMWVSGNPERLTVVYPGQYLVQGRAGFPDSEYGYRAIGIRVWDASAEAYVYLAENRYVANDATRMHIEAKTPELVAGDWVEVYVYQSSGGNRDTLAGSATDLRVCSASMVRVP